MATKIESTEQAEVDRMLAELHEHGYVDLAEYTYPRSGRVLRVGARVRHRNEQYWQAIERGTGNVVGLVHKPDSPWSRSWRMADVELIMLRDEERFGTRLSQVAHYHVEVIEDGRAER